MFVLTHKKGITAYGGKCYDLSLTADKVVEKPSAKDPYRKVTIYAPDEELLQHLYEAGTGFVEVKTKIAKPIEEPVETEEQTKTKKTKDVDNNRNIQPGR